MKILLLAIDRVPHLGVSFRSALESLGHSVVVADPTGAYTILDRGPLKSIARLLRDDAPSGQWLFDRSAIRLCRDFDPDLVIGVGGCLTAGAIREIRGKSRARLVMYTTDNPFNLTACREFVRQSVPHWDIIATPRRATMGQLREHGARHVIYLPFGYDPNLHFPESPRNEAEAYRFRSDVAFLGGCDNDRVPFLNPLAEAEDLNVAFYGGYYRQTAALKRRNKGFAYGRDYRLALCGTSVALCLVRRANADGHVMRTFEVPACGAFLLAERTEEHEDLFEENREAVFFSGPDEMIDKIRFFVRSQDLRNRIAAAGHKRIVDGGNTYRDRLRSLIAAACDAKACSEL